MWPIATSYLMRRHSFAHKAQDMGRLAARDAQDCSLKPISGADSVGRSRRVRVLNLAWRQALTPTLKLVPMALADAADDHGVCWPSVSTLAKKCSVSTRTVQRSLRFLIDSGLLTAEPRRRRDGSSI